MFIILMWFSPEDPSTFTPANHWSSASSKKPKSSLKSLINFLLSWTLQKLYKKIKKILFCMYCTQVKKLVNGDYTQINKHMSASSFPFWAIRRAPAFSICGFLLLSSYLLWPHFLVYFHYAPHLFYILLFICFLHKQAFLPSSNCLPLIFSKCLPRSIHQAAASLVPLGSSHLALSPALLSLRHTLHLIIWYKYPNMFNICWCKLFPSWRACQFFWAFFYLYFINSMISKYFLHFCAYALWFTHTS